MDVIVLGYFFDRCPQPVYYTFGHSVWAAAGELAMCVHTIHRAQIESLTHLQC